MSNVCFTSLQVISMHTQVWGPPVWFMLTSPLFTSRLTSVHLVPLYGHLSQEWLFPFVGNKVAICYTWLYVCPAFVEPSLNILFRTLGVPPPQNRQLNTKFPHFLIGSEKVCYLHMPIRCTQMGTGYEKGRQEVMVTDKSTDRWASTMVQCLAPWQLVCSLVNAKW